MGDHRGRDAHRATGSISAIPGDVCITLLLGSPVGWVAFVRPDGAQELLPVNFTVLDDAIYFRTSVASPLSLLARGLGNVAFGVHGVDSSAGHGWNVTVHGAAARVTDPNLLRAIKAAGLRQPWAGGARDEVVGIAIERIDGRRVVRVGSATP